MKDEIGGEPGGRKISANRRPLRREDLTEEQWRAVCAVFDLEQKLKAQLLRRQALPPD